MSTSVVRAERAAAGGPSTWSDSGLAPSSAPNVRDAIDLGIEVLPMKSMQEQMSSGPGYYEGALYDVARAKDEAFPQFLLSSSVLPRGRVGPATTRYPATHKSLALVTVLAPRLPPAGCPLASN